MTLRNDPVAEALAVVGEISAAELAARMESKSSGQFLLIDCREPAEFVTGVIPGASLVPQALIRETFSEASLSADMDIVVYCAAGMRSALAAKKLHDMGFKRATSLAGGINRWGTEGYPVEFPDSALTPEQRQRYARHLVLPEVGEEGQRRLLDSKVAIVGAGGLGSPVALYLAAAGVGTLGIVDFDEVEASNLQRQILHRIDRIGRPKVDSARETLSSINPDVDVIAHRRHLAADNVIELLGGYDVIVDGADNFPTRYLINDASLHLRTSVIHGSIFRFEGQASVFHPYQGPCYRCLFPLPPPPELAPNCAEAGVLGVLPGIIGSIQAMETLKILLKIGEPLIGRLLVYDGLDQTFTNVQVRRDANCPACADPSNPPLLVDYDSSCQPVSVAGQSTN